MKTKKTEKYKKIPYKDSNSKVIPGVTTVLSELQSPEGLIKWANDLGIIGKNAWREKKKAAEIGQDSHFLLQNHLLKKEVFIEGFSEEVLNAYFSGRRFLEAVPLRALHVELRMRCECGLHEPYGGTIDLVYEDFLGRVGILDWKTAKKLYENNLLQLIGYTHLWEHGDIIDENNEVIDDFGISRRPIENYHLVMLSKEIVSYKDYYFDRTPDLENYWIDSLRIYNSKKAIGKML